MGTWYRYHHLFQELLRSRAGARRARPGAASSSRARPTGVRRTSSPRRPSGTRRQAGDVDRVARLVERCALPAYQSGRVATAERWLDWLEERGALERNAAVAVLAALVATVWGRPAEAERLAEAAERATLRRHPARRQRSRSTRGWPSCAPCVVLRGVARMRADAELATPNARPRQPVPPDTPCCCSRSRSGWPARSTEADDLLADVAEEGLELGAARAGGGGARRARRDRDRARRVGPGRGARGPGASGHPPVADGGVPHQRIRLCGGGPRRAPPRGRRARPRAPRPSADACGRGSPTRCRTSRSRPAWSSPAPTWPSPTPAEPGRCCARSRRCCAGNQISGCSRPRWRSCARSLKTMRADAPGASTLTAAELRLLPYLATHLSFPEIGRAPVPVAPHREITRHGDLPQAQRDLPHRRGRARPRVGLL